MELCRRTSLTCFPVTIAWCNSDGIYILTAGDISGSFTVRSLTDNKLKKFFDTIPLESKKWAKGVFNPYTKVIQWCYASSAPSSENDRYSFDKILNFNVVSTAFYPWDIPDHPNDIVGLFLYAGPSSVVSDQPVLADSVTVTSDSETVTSEENIISELNPTFKYITYTGSSTLTFSETNDIDYVDWQSSGNSLNYSSFFVTGYRIHGQGNKDFQSNYVTVYSETKDTPSIFHFNGYWDFTNNVASGKVSTKQYVNLANTEYDYSRRRLKVRGQGHSLQFRVQSITDNPFNTTGS